MSGFEQELNDRLEKVQRENLMRRLRVCDSPQGTEIAIDGAKLLNFSSNDYLGLATHPALKEAAIKAIERFGTGSGASRLICGSLAPHHDLERSLAQWKGTEAALAFSSGYATALGAVCAVVGREDIVVLDKLVHASIVDAARLSGAKLRVFGHNNLADLEEILVWAKKDRGAGKVLVATESVFSMDGDLAPLSELVELKEKYDAWLMVDEAHACGLFGKRRSGRVEAEGLQGRVEIQMGTLGKALGSSGGFIAGAQSLIDYLVNKARSFIFSTAPSPANSAAAEAAVHLVQTEAGHQLSDQLWKRVAQLGAALNIPTVPNSPIIPILIGSEQETIEISARLRESGFFIPAIRYPTVARGKARLRVSLSAAHSEGQIKRLAAALRDLKISVS